MGDGWPRGFHSTQFGNPSASERGNVLSPTMSFKIQKFSLCMRSLPPHICPPTVADLYHIDLAFQPRMPSCCVNIAIDFFRSRSSPRMRSITIGLLNPIHPNTSSDATLPSAIIKLDPGAFVPRDTKEHQAVPPYDIEPRNHFHLICRLVLSCTEKGFGLRRKVNRRT